MYTTLAGENFRHVFRVCTQLKIGLFFEFHVSYYCDMNDKSPFYAEKWRWKNFLIAFFSLIGRAAVSGKISITGIFISLSRSCCR